MQNKDKISHIINNQKILRKLGELGVYPTQIVRGPKGVDGKIGPTGPKGDIGPTGPMGEGLEILASYDTEEEFLKNHPTGKKGDCYIVNGILYVWDSEHNSWKKLGNIVGPTGPTGPKGDTGPRGLPGEIGISEVITIDKTETLDPGEEAEVQDDFDKNIHHLTFYIPKGEKGDKGDTGPAGPTGPQGSLGPTSYDAVCFASFKDSNSAGTSTITTTRIIPGKSDIVSISGNQIKISRTSVFEITLCGRISGVTNDTGGKFYLYNTTTSEKISDMEFTLNKGSTSDMDFSEVNFADIYTGGNLEVRTEIIGNDTGNISFSMINVILKSYKL